MSSEITLAIPSKGSMEEPTLRFLADCGLGVRRSNPRQYSARLRSVDVQAIFQRAADIPVKLGMGLVDVGITGFDIFNEHMGESDGVMIGVEDLGFGRCQLVLAVPESWIDVTSFEDLTEVAAEFRRRGRTLRVATKFPRLTRRFLLEQGLTSFTLVESSGALEIAPSMGYADLIADINETGTTLRANHLKPIEGGTVLESQACLLIHRRSFTGRPERVETLRTILELIEAHQRAAEVVSVTANVLGECMEAVAAQVLQRRDLAGMRGPTVTPVFDPDTPGRVFAVTVVVGIGQLVAAKDHLRKLGGGAITVTRPLYAFDERSHLYDRLVEGLEG